MKTGVMKVGLLLLFFFLPGLSLAAETFHLGIFAYRPVEIIEKRWQNLETYLEQQVPNSDFVLHILQLDELEKGVQQNRFDFVFTNPRHFIETLFSLTLDILVKNQSMVFWMTKSISYIRFPMPIRPTTRGWFRKI